MPGLLNFDLAIDPHGDGFRARVLSSPAGEAENVFAFPFTDQDLEILILRVIGSVGRARRQLRRFESAERRLLEDFGGQLFQAVFAGSVRTCFERSVTAAEAADTGLRIRLRLAPAVQNAPWEYLHDREYGFLSLSPETPVVRYLPIPKPVRPLPVRPPLRILAMIAAPTDLQRLQHEEEWQKLRSSLGELIDRGMVQLDRLPVGSLAALQRPLRTGDYHVLHFVGHGLYDETVQDGALVLEDDNGQSRLVTGRDLGMMLRGSRSLRLVVLNACEGARSAVDDPFGGVAQALVRQGLPAVIAMQFEISDPAALLFSQSFYQAVADLLPTDVAMVEARRAIFAADNEVEWATPVIYLRASDGRIFAEVPPEPAAEEASRRDELAQHAAERRQREQAEREQAEREQAEREQAERDELARRAAEQRERAAALQREEAARLEEAARREELARQEATARREEAARQERAAAERRQREEALREQERAEWRRQVEAWHEAAEMAVQQRRWDDAVAVLEQLVETGENGPETVQRLTFARAQQERDRLISELRRLYSAEHWADVLAVSEHLARLGAATKETDRLAMTARTKLEKATRARAREEAQAAGRPVVAEMPARFVARLVDLGIYLIPFIALAPPNTGETSTELTARDSWWLGGVVLTIAVYEVVLTALLGGTLGKRLLRLRVVRAVDGAPIGWRESLLRWFIQFLAWCTCIAPVVLYVSPFWDKSARHQGWHDRVAGTAVVKLPPR
jgi:uncharacterized RDD family membrane protein YckC